TVVTAITAQNTVGVQRAHPVPAAMVEAQLESVVSDFAISAAKTGMLYDAEIIRCVATRWQSLDIPLVVDPVMVATSGDALMAGGASTALREHLFPVAALVTPNLPEAAILSGMAIRSREDMETAAQRIAESCPDTSILVKGGHMEGDLATDLLLHKGDMQWISAPWIPSDNTHGTGCTLSAAIAARLALGHDIPEAVRLAKSYITEAIRQAWHGLGKGRGSLRHHIPTSTLA
ncbi:MAG: bifunctional hydroxymethylpyrimidine kinase/phosphomethylpyrimidine kinase, partial [Bacteroidota bacterium]